MKIFFACADVGVTRDVDEKSMRACKIFSDRGASRAKTQLQEVLIPSSVFQYLQHAVGVRFALLRNAARLHA
jgi:hypothetical protein